MAHPATVLDWRLYKGSQSDAGHVQVVTEPEVAEQSAHFEQAMVGGDPTALLGLCDAKAEGLPGDEGETWAFLRIHFQQDPRR